MLFIEGKSFVRMDNFMDLIELKIGFVEQIKFGFKNMIIFNPQHFISDNIPKFMLGGCGARWDGGG